MCMTMTMSTPTYLPRWALSDDSGRDQGMNVPSFPATRPMTRFEFARLVGIRVGQLFAGDPPRALPPGPSPTPYDIAAAEIKTGALRGLEVMRVAPDGTTFVLDVQDMVTETRRPRFW
jgi:DNA-directed RNA polymerase subunit K/omega